MRARSHRDILLGDVDTDRKALGVDIGEMMFGLLRIFVRYIQTHMIDGMDLHLIIDGTCHDITRCQTQTRVVFLHELFAVRQSQNTSVPAHGFGDEVSRMRLFGIEQTRRVELHELHIFDQSFGTIDHRDTVSGSYLGVGGGGIDRSRSSGGHQGDTAQIGVDLLGLGIEDIRSVAFDIRRASGNANAQMVLRDDLHGKMILQYVDIRIIAHRFHQTPLDLRTRVIGMVEDTELGVSAFAVQVKITVFFLIEVNAPVDQFLNPSRCITYHLFHCPRVA